MLNGKVLPPKPWPKRAMPKPKREARDRMYSTGTEFYKLIGQAQDKPVNTAADIADGVKEAIESNTPIHVVRMTLKHGVDMTVVGKLTEK